MPTATQVVNAAFNEGIKPDPEWLISEWANERRILPEGSSKEHGPYRAERTPHCIEIMDSLSPSCPTPEICFMKGVQIAGSTIGENFILYTIDVAPGPAIVVYPTAELAEDYSKDRLQPSIDAMPTIAAKVAPSKSRSSGNTITAKRYPGGNLKLVGGNSPKAARSRPARYLSIDDCDGIDETVGKEGNTVALFKKRTTTYGTQRKIYINSTPTLKGFSAIEREYEGSDQRERHVPCPHCNELQVLEWGGKDADFGMKFTHEGPRCTDVWYVCKHCKNRIDERWKDWMFDESRAKWIPKHPELTEKRRGYRLPSFYSPLGWYSWRQIVEEFLAAVGNPELMKVVHNQLFCKTWEDEGTALEWEQLKNRAEEYQTGRVPMGGLLLTMGVDVHPDRLEFSVYAFGRGEECWLVYRGKIFGSIDDDQTREELDGVRLRSFPHASGLSLNIACVAVDSGNQTHSVYDYCRTRAPQVIAVKGQKTQGQPIIGRPKYQDVNWKGQKIEKGVQMWPVGTDTAKELIYQRLRMTEPGPRTIHIPASMDDDYFKQLTAERCVTVYIKGYPQKQWRVVTGRRNEALDEFVYALAAAHRLGLPRMDWDSLERSISSQKKPEQKQPQQKQVAKSSYVSQTTGGEPQRGDVARSRHVMTMIGV